MKGHTCIGLNNYNATFLRCLRREIRVEMSIKDHYETVEGTRNPFKRFHYDAIVAVVRVRSSTAHFVRHKNPWLNPPKGVIQVVYYDMI